MTGFVTVIEIDATWGRDVIWPHDDQWEAFKQQHGQPLGPFRHRVIVPTPFAAELPAELALPARLNSRV